MKTRVWTAVGACLLTLGAVDCATNGALSGQPYTAATAVKPAPSHSAPAPKATPTAAKSKPGTVKRAPTVTSTVGPATLARLSQDGDAHGAYCTVIFSANRDGTLHLAAVLGERGKTGAVALDARSTNGDDWLGGNLIADADTWNNHPFAGMTQMVEMNAPVKLGDVREIAGTLAPGDGDELRDCMVTPVPSLT
ncbi:hypothetical protein [Streptomyces sp. B1-3]|uniref:hypothetical protein n=1 Tax=Streptomyces sp. B1-3 TaxID=3141453 RepID=UPI003D2E3D57